MHDTERAVCVCVRVQVQPEPLQVRPSGEQLPVWSPCRVCWGLLPGGQAGKKKGAHAGGLPIRYVIYAL